MDPEGTIQIKRISGRYERRLDKDIIPDWPIRTGIRRRAVPIVA